MSPQESRIFWFWVKGDPLAVPYEVVDIPIDANITRLKAIIQQKIQYLHNTNAYNLKLFKLNVMVPIDPDRSLEQRLENLGDIAACSRELSSAEKVGKIFPEPPSEDHLHIVVQCPARVVPPSPSDVSGILHLYPRKDTVTALYEQLKKYHFILVRGTPGSGKTVLSKLLAAHIEQQDHSVERVIRISLWPPKSERGNYYDYLKQQGWRKDEKTVFILDEGQSTYDDANLWIDFFKPIHEVKGHRRAIVFASYGSPTSSITLTGIPLTPLFIPNRQRVTLRHITHDVDLRPVGLLFTRSEFDNLVNKHYCSSEFHFDSSFLDALFRITDGHVGAIHDFISVIIQDDSYRELKHDASPVYTWDLFMTKVNPLRLLTQLGSFGIFRRGLPPDAALQDSAATARVLSAVLLGDFVKDNDYEDDSDERRALDRCFRSGWLHADLLEDTNDITGYFFPSSLHRWYVEWKLWGRVNDQGTQFQVNNLLELVIKVIRLFSPSHLSSERRLGPGCIQRLPEAHYQDELYHCCNVLSEGSLLTYPEYGTQDGRVDFYIPAKCWGIELSREGDRVAAHCGRFSKGSYRELPLTDYIIVDCRTTRPIKRHPHMSKLYHAVFENNFKHVCILDNSLHEVDNFELFER